MLHQRPSEYLQLSQVPVTWPLISFARLSSRSQGDSWVRSSVHLHPRLPNLWLPQAETGEIRSCGPAAMHVGGFAFLSDDRVRVEDRFTLIPGRAGLGSFISSLQQAPAWPSLASHSLCSAFAHLPEEAGALIHCYVIMINGAGGHLGLVTGSARPE